MLFCAGFNRGTSWGLAKQKGIQYAKVKDNFGDNDKGKEKFIDKVGEVLQVESDYHCFSQVQLKFDDDSIEWFSNTAPEEVIGKEE